MPASYDQGEDSNPPCGARLIEQPVKYTDARVYDLGMAAMTAPVLNPLATSLNSANLLVRRKVGVSVGSSTMSPAVAAVRTTNGTQCLPIFGGNRKTSPWSRTTSLYRCFQVRRLAKSTSAGSDGERMRIAVDSGSGVTAAGSFPTWLFVAEPPPTSWHSPAFAIGTMTAARTTPCVRRTRAIRDTRIMVQRSGPATIRSASASNVTS